MLASAHVSDCRTKNMLSKFWKVLWGQTVYGQSSEQIEHLNDSLDTFNEDRENWHPTVTTIEHRVQLRAGTYVYEKSNVWVVDSQNIVKETTQMYSYKFKILGSIQIVFMLATIAVYGLDECNKYFPDRFTYYVQQLSNSGEILLGPQAVHIEKKQASLTVPCSPSPAKSVLGFADEVNLLL